MRVDPVFVLSITRADGTVLYEHRHSQARAISEQVADEVTTVLQHAVARGTGTRARLRDRPVAGKTGTGQEWRDAWFVGYTPDIVTAVWMGYADEGRRSMKPPATPLRVTGGSWPATIWNRFMTPVTSGSAVRLFPEVVLREGTDAPLELDDLLLPKVPDVGGLSIGVARAVLDGHGYLVQERAVDAPAVAPGTVVGQSPVPASGLAVGETVLLDVARGGTVVDIPDTLGLLEHAARTALGTAGFLVEVIVQDGGAPGTVWQQSPGVGPAVPGSTVTIWVSPPEIVTTTTTTSTTAPPATTTTTATAPPETTTTTLVERR